MNVRPMVGLLHGTNLLLFKVEYTSLVLLRFGVSQLRSVSVGFSNKNSGFGPVFSWQFVNTCLLSKQLLKLYLLINNPAYSIKMRMKN